MIGVYGGSFDPIHNGHLRAALEVQQYVNLSDVKFIPCGQHALHKEFQASSIQRLAMLKRAIKDHAQFSIDTLELDSSDTSYMLETLATLKQRQPKETLAFILGVDAFLELPKWHQWQKLLNLASIIVMLRPGYELPSSGEMADYLKQHQIQSANDLVNQTENGIYLMTLPLLNISSSYIRTEIQEKRNPAYLLPASVLEYIEQQNIYL